MFHCRDYRGVIKLTFDHVRMGCKVTVFAISIRKMPSEVLICATSMLQSPSSVTSSVVEPLAAPATPISPVKQPGDQISTVQNSALADGEAPIPMKVVAILYLPPYGPEKDVNRWRKDLDLIYEKVLRNRVHIIVSDPPYENDTADGTRCYVKPAHHTPHGRIKLLRKALVSSIVGLLSKVTASQPQIIVGVEVGTLVALMCTRRLVVKAACRARTIVASEMYRIRSAWCGAVSIAWISPMVKQQHHTTEELIQAVPEFCFEHPGGGHVCFLDGSQGVQEVVRS